MEARIPCADPTDEGAAVAEQSMISDPFNPAQAGYPVPDVTPLPEVDRFEEPRLIPRSTWRLLAILCLPVLALAGITAVTHPAFAPLFVALLAVVAACLLDRKSVV